MVTWNEERVISAHIEKVWDLFSDENMQRIMPNVVEHTPIELKEGIVGSKHRQSYKEGKRVETYIVETLGYENTESKKHLRIGFTLGKAFEIEAAYTFIKLDETRTRFIYTGRNKGVNFLGKVMLKLAGEKSNQKIIQDFMDRVEEEVMKESTPV
ncbi:SRPBCC family protein [Fictibacillus phosphorivorans]|uniref:SRPBCC family protein n=1 Tax=Fictibacillus phosphorivorans TaxID=1221500 RepID=UPI00203EC604|nr:SRPBCC family protein [Fictibacillus phosphorivorans]MCM3719426.1 SRPBCC family protein [Fictibacillus phosphorivorans]MCM3777096.1 SRPBCC family protein [Fictibacillus phosphorivorans]